MLIDVLHISLRQNMRSCFNQRFPINKHVVPPTNVDVIFALREMLNALPKSAGCGDLIGNKARYCIG